MLGCKSQHQRKFQLENQEAKRTITNYPDSPLPDLLLSLKQKYSNNTQCTNHVTSFATLSPGQACTTQEVASDRINVNSSRL